MSLIEQALKPLGLVGDAVKTSVPNRTAVVVHLAEVQPHLVCQALNDKMLGARILTTGGAADAGRDQRGRSNSLAGMLMDGDSLLCRVILGVQLITFCTGLTCASVEVPWYVTCSLYMATVILGHALVRRAALSVLGCRASVHLLMFIVMVGALCLGQLREAATVALLVGGSEWLVGKVNDAVETAMNKSMVAQATHATKIESEGNYVVVPISQIQPGDALIVRTGEAVPVDGKVRTSDDMQVDEAAVTGEALPIEKPVGAQVSSGTVVVAGAGEIVCAAKAEGSFQGRMQQAIDDARNSRSQTEELVNRVAAWYTPMVVLGAVIVAACTGQVSRGLAALVSACPCALLAAAPVIQSCTLVRMLSELQVLVKNTETLEKMGRLTALAFDKTGTLTEGSFTLADACVLQGSQGRSKEELLQLLAAVESKDPHPLAHCLVQAYTGCVADFHANSILPKVTNFTRVESMGVWGMVSGQVVGAGSARFLDAMTVDLPNEATEVVKQWEEQRGAFTAVYMTLDDEVAMVLCLEDQVRPDAAAAVADLKNYGIGAALLTGDHPRPAKIVAKQVGITEIHAALQPKGKECWIRNQQMPPDESAKGDKGPEDQAEQGLAAPLLKTEPGKDNLKRKAQRAQVVGMLGDGLNDSPALAAADVGIAISAGLQLTMDAADVVLNKGEPMLSRLAEAVRLAKRCRQGVLQNLAIAAAIKIAALVMAATGNLSLSLGVLTDTGSLLIILLSSLRPFVWHLSIP